MTQKLNMGHKILSVQCLYADSRLTTIWRATVLSLCTGVISSPAFATDGYFSNGIGIQAKGLGGASIAYPKDSLSIATNPAAALFLGDRFDFGVEWFRPDREATLSGTPLGFADGTYSGNGRENFLIPELGYTHQINANWAFGIAAYGNGGMNTKYHDNPYAAYGSHNIGGVNLEQLFVSPTLAYRIAPNHAIGAAVNIGYQRLKAYGIDGFAGFSENPGFVSNKNSSYVWGSGVRLGYLGHLTPRLSLGANWQSKTYFDEFDKYKGLFADGGDFDAPSTYGVGLAYKLTPRLDITGEVQRIEYSDVNSVGNASFGKLFAGKQLGSHDGSGFGWQDVNVYRVGLNYQIDPQWQVRSGWAYSSQPIKESETFFNILAPATVQHHFTAGFTWEKPDSGWEYSGYALYAPENKVEGNGSIPASFGGGEADVKLSEFAVGFQVGYKFGEMQSLKDQ